MNFWLFMGGIIVLVGIPLVLLSNKAIDNGTNERQRAEDNHLINILNNLNRPYSLPPQPMYLVTAPVEKKTEPIIEIFDPATIEKEDAEKRKRTL